MKRRAVWLLVFLWLLPVLACNMPVRKSGGEGAGQPVLQTLTALTPEEQVDTGPQPAEPTPLPGLPVVTIVGAPPADPDSHESRNGSTFEYTTQPGDTTGALALRFGVDAQQILDPQQVPPQAMLLIGQKLSIPDVLGPLPFSGWLLPDSEIVYSPSTVDFSIQDYVQSAGGYLSTYTEQVDGQTLSGAQVVQRIAEDTSTNPRILLAFLEYRSHWVLSTPENAKTNPYPIGFYADTYSGLYKELTLVSRQLTIGYYGWRTGDLVNLEFVDHKHQRINPTMNAGTAALQYLFAKLYHQEEWQGQLYDPGDFMAFYRQMFGDPWQRAAAVEPLLPDHLAQPAIELPFHVGESWSLTGGPHAAWGVGSPWGGLDFAPASVEKGCGVSRYWATAAASGLVVRSGNGQVIIDLDGDGHEQTGWVLLYLHIAQQDRVAVGTHVEVNDQIGHPSCEGGFSTGTHEHIARKYNGEWQAADGPLPFVLSGWQAWSGERAYSGTLTKDGQVVNARPDGARTSMITRK